MNPNDPTDGALDPDERELARVLRALPSGEPPAALDARILRAAADAAASAPARRRRALGLFGGGSALWGIGTAAAAVLALGIGWQAMYGHQPLLPGSSPVALPADAASDDSVSVEFRDRTSLAEKASETAGAPPPPPPALADREFPRVRSRAPANRVEPAGALAPAPAAPAAEAFPETGLDEHVAARAEAGAAGDAFAAERDEPLRASAEGRAQAYDNAAASAKVATQAAAVAERRADQARAEQSGAEAAQAESAARLRPASWLAQVRSLRAAGKTDEARARLVEFRKAYPHWVIPTDLAPLLTNE